MSVNKVILVGRLGKDSEIQYTPSGMAVLKNSLATSEQWKDKDGNKKEKTEWCNIVLFGKQAEGLSKYLMKGVQIYLIGKLQTRSWEKNGVKHYITEIIAIDVKLLSYPANMKKDDKKAASGELISQIDQFATDYFPGATVTGDSDYIPF